MSTTQDRTGTSVMPRRWWILAMLGSAQLMVALDNTIVNVALPSARSDLGFDAGDRQWIVTAYALAFGSLLLLGGRLSDLLGRKRALVTGLIGFAGASAVGGAATGFGLLVAGRTVQGAFGALLAPTVLSLMSETFPGGKTRARAFGILSALVGSGAAVGLVLGGLLTEYLNWRWTMYINAVFATAAVVGALLLLTTYEERARPRIDVIGTAAASGGLFVIVFGLARAGTGDWLSPVVLGPLLGGVVLLAGFVLWQRTARSPLLPLRVLRDRDRAGAYVNRFIASTGNFAVTFFMTFFLQESLGLSPLLTGVAVIPMVLGIVGASNTFGAMLPRLGPRPLIVAGLLVAAASLLWLSRLSPSTSYWSGVMVPLFLFGTGQGMTTTVAMSTATINLAAADVGVAAALVSVMQQLGGSVGTALLSTVALATAAGYAGSHGGDAAGAAVHGYDVAFLTAACVFAGTAVLCGALIRGRTGGGAGAAR